MNITRRDLLASALPAVSASSAPSRLFSAGARAAGRLRAAVFQADATPPLGHMLCCSPENRARVVEEPLLLKGVVLADGASRYVLCALDWCVLRLGAHDVFKRALAAAARTPESHVTIHTVHNHDAPIADSQAQRLLARQPEAFALLDLDFLEVAAKRAAEAVREATGRLRAFDSVACGRGRVERYASSRRVRTPDGRITTRYSSTKDPALRAAPEGAIDPFVRTVTLLDGETPLVRLHYYATHPQSHYGKGGVTPDVPGLARARLEREERIPHIYFTGCGGDVTAGKYNDGSDQARAELVDRLHAGMRAAIAASRVERVSSLGWRTAEVRFARRADPELLEAKLRADLADPKAPPVRRVTAAFALAWYERLAARPGVELSCLRLGGARLLHLPGEAFLEYQRYALALRPDAFVAVAAYGEGGPGYVCTDAAYAEGGYEPTQSFVGPPSEARLKAAIAALLRPT